VSLHFKVIASNTRICEDKESKTAIDEKKGGEYVKMVHPMPWTRSVKSMMLSTREEREGVVVAMTGDG
jgi:hypothetical protein